MAACADFKALGQIAKLSGSFALSGLVAHSLILNRADAYFSPVYVPLLEQPYPVRRQSGKIIKDFRAKELGEADVVSGSDHSSQCTQPQLEQAATARYCANCRQMLISIPWLWIADLSSQ